MDISSIEKASAVKAFARKSQFGKIFSFDKKVIISDGVFRTTSRVGIVSHILILVFIFYLGTCGIQVDHFFKVYGWSC